MHVLIVTWDDIQSSLLILADKIENSGYRPDMIVGIARGGWVVARILSDLLRVDDIASLRISFYRGVNEKGRKPVIVQPVSASPKGKNVLIVDDVSDSGESLLLARAHISRKGAKGIMIATLHLKPWSKMVPDYYVDYADSWILYPWELRETLDKLLRIWSKDTPDTATLKNRLLSVGIPHGIVERYMPANDREGDP